MKNQKNITKILVIALAIALPTVGYSQQSVNSVKLTAEERKMLQERKELRRKRKDLVRKEENLFREERYLDRVEVSLAGLKLDIEQIKSSIKKIQIYINKEAQKPAKRPSEKKIVLIMKKEELAEKEEELASAEGRLRKGRQSVLERRGRLTGSSAKSGNITLPEAKITHFNINNYKECASDDTNAEVIFKVALLSSPVYYMLWAWSEYEFKIIYELATGKVLKPYIDECFMRSFVDHPHRPIYPWNSEKNTMPTAGKNPAKGSKPKQNDAQ